MSEFDYEVTSGQAEDSDAPAWPELIGDRSVVLEMLRAQDDLAVDWDSSVLTQLLDLDMERLLDAAEATLDTLVQKIEETLGRETTEEERLLAYRRNLIQSLAMLSAMYSTLPEWMQEMLKVVMSGKGDDDDNQ